MPLLDPTALARLLALPLNARQAMLGNVSGRHRSPVKGSSLEFAQYRKYVPGDDTRRLDWRTWGRSDRFYIKEFEADTNLRLCLIVDASGSMDYPDPAPGKRTRMDLARLFRGRSPAGPDCPDRLVGDHELFGLGSAQCRQQRLKLPIDDLFGLPGLTLGQRLTHTGDHTQARGERRTRLVGDRLIMLAVDAPALGMADDRPGATDIEQHGRRNFARMRTIGKGRDILRAQRDGHTRNGLSNGGKIGEGRTDDALNLRETRITLPALRDRVHERESLGRKTVHLPVADHHGFANACQHLEHHPRREKPAIVERGGQWVKKQRPPERPTRYPDLRGDRGRPVPVRRAAERGRPATPPTPSRASLIRTRRSICASEVRWA